MEKLGAYGNAVYGRTGPFRGCGAAPGGFIGGQGQYSPGPLFTDNGHWLHFNALFLVGPAADFFLRLSGFGGFPPLGMAGRSILFCRPLTLGITGAMDLMRLTRTSVLEVLGPEFCTDGQGKRDCLETAVLGRHVLRNAVIPVITAIGLHFSHLAGGTVLIEMLFAWPGVGRYLVQASAMRDIPVIQGVVLMSTVFFLLLNLAIDLAYTVLDPRIRIKGSHR